MPVNLFEVQCLGTYFNFIMGMVASSVLLTVLVLNYHHRHPDTHNMPTWVRPCHVLHAGCLGWGDIRASDTIQSTAVLTVLLFIVLADRICSLIAFEYRQPN